MYRLLFYILTYVGKLNLLIRNISVCSKGLCLENYTLTEISAKYKVRIRILVAAHKESALSR